jgi:2,4-dienoyl-CoA reductase-like NADH-dependent reductase (Old Yellow Enzyme family)
MFKYKIIADKSNRAHACAVGHVEEGMWRPPQRIPFEAAHGRIPSVKEAAEALLFSPLEVGKLRLAQRTWVPAMVPWRATEDGFVTDGVIEWYSRFARGQPGAIVVEATGIRDIPSGPLLRIGHDRFIPGLQRLCTAVREASRGRTKLFIQLIDFLAIRRRPERAKFLQMFLRITDAHRQALGNATLCDAEVRNRLAALSDSDLARVLAPRELEALQFGHRERITDLDLPHIRELPTVLPGLFADAATRAKAAGFDGVELHYAHAYTMASFLSLTNTRDDGYGGSRAGRIRLPTEVIAAVRARVGHDYVIGCRYLADECIEGGSPVDDAVYFGVELARAGLDFISTSRGGKFDDAKQPGIGAAVYPYTGPSGYECMPQHISDERGPFGRNVGPTAQIRGAIRAAGFDTPVVCTGGIHNFELAERLLTEGVCDIVGAARQSLADPDWFLKLASGQGRSVRICNYTNYCEGLDQKHKPVTCQLWDKEGLGDPGVMLTPDGRRRLTAPEWQQVERSDSGALRR